eukprot:sb/3477894/
MMPLNAFLVNANALTTVLARELGQANALTVFSAFFYLNLRILNLLSSDLRFSNLLLLFVFQCFLRFRRFASSVPDRLFLLRIQCSRLGFFPDSLGGLVLRLHEL